jgi:hypothetical protein
MVIAHPHNRTLDTIGRMAPLRRAGRVRMDPSMRFMKSIVATLILALTAMVLPTEASAGTLRLRLENLLTGTGVILTDGGSGDANPVVGAVTLVDFFDNTVSVSTGASQPLIGDGSLAHLDLNSINLVTSGPVQLQLTLEDTNFTVDSPSQIVSLIGQIGGTLTAPAGSTVTAQSWVNPTNSAPALGADTGAVAVSLPAIGATPAGSVAAFSPVFSSGPGAFSATDYATFLYNGPFSLFTQLTINFAGPGSVSFNQDALVPVPEPGTLLLFGTGLIGVARLARRRRTTTTS